MFNKKIKVAIFILLVISIIFLLLAANRASNSVFYQLDKLVNGSIKEKIVASDFVKEHRLSAAIPILIANINSSSEFIFKNNIQRNLSCASLEALVEISGVQASDLDTCDRSIFEKKYLLDKAQDDWWAWYKISEYKDWRMYRNERLGFEIKYPTSYWSLGASCSFKAGSYQLDSGMVPTKIFETKDKIYIAPEYFYEISDAGCKKNNYQLNNLEDFGLWEIIIKKGINNDNDLSIFLGDFYKGFGSACKLGNKEESLQKGVYDIYTDWDGKDLTDSSCYINALTFVKYFPKQAKVAAWLIGQEYVFGADDSGRLYFDQAMAGSFRFLY